MLGAQGTACAASRAGAGEADGELAMTARPGTLRGFGHFWWDFLTATPRNSPWPWGCVALAFGPTTDVAATDRAAPAGHRLPAGQHLSMGASAPAAVDRNGCRWRAHRPRRRPPPAPGAPNHLFGQVRGLGPRPVPLATRRRSPDRVLRDPGPIDSQS